MEAEINKTYCNVTRTAIQTYLSLCKECRGKRKLKTKRVVAAPTISTTYMNSRCQVALIDMQNEPDADYRFILKYQDHLTKFTILKPLKTKTADEVADSLMDIFGIFGAPFILHSGNGCKFASKIIQNLANMWPKLKLVHGKPCMVQSPESLDSSNQDLHDLLAAWMLDNKTKQWSRGLKFIQSEKNRSFNGEIKKSPSEAMFGTIQKIGLADSILEKEAYERMETEEDLEWILNNINVKEEENQDGNGECCAICEADGILLTCQKCNLKTHVKCGLKTEDEIICNLCNKSEDLSNLSKEELAPIVTGQNVILEMPGKLLPGNGLAVVLSINEGGLYKLGTVDGELEKLYSRNEFTLADFNSICASEVPGSSALPSGSKSDFVVCKCKRYCISRRCNCRLNEVQCNSKCHKNTACKNKLLFVSYNQS